ncbi:MAG: helix-turn-helix transcriptional regulator [Robiginitalea sp.]|jgi:transcriptional regulator with XRE-family HTH domain
MVNTTAFRERLETILKYYDLSATAFAEEIGVQRSSISHLLSGRNKPSLDFVLKVVQRFPEVNLYWLLNGKGSFPGKKEQTPPSPAIPNTMEEKGIKGKERAVEKIVVFYSDGSFREYLPH